MDFTIFYSWQSDTNPKYNNYFIREAINCAIKRLSKENKGNFKPLLARADNPEQAGSRNVVSLINDLIKNCDIFIADVTYVTSYKTFAKTGEEERNKGSINSNVAIELGQAKALAGDARIIKVMNAYYDSPTNGLEMPFDIEQDRRPHEYTLSESDTRDLYKSKFKALGDFFYSALSNIIREHDALQKKRYKPFLTYKKWANFVKQDYEYWGGPHLTDTLLCKFSN